MLKGAEGRGVDEMSFLELSLYMGSGIVCMWRRQLYLYTLIWCRGYIMVERENDALMYV